MTDAERGSERLDEVGAWVRSATRPMSQAQRIEGLQAVTLRLEVRRHTRPRRVISSLILAGAVATGAVLFVRAARRGPFHPAPSSAAKEARAIDYRVEGGEIGDGGYVRSFDAAGARLRFSEGTEVHLLAGARGRLGRVDANGARFAIEHGAAEVHVTPRTGARWLVDAGPFLIAVRGTVFTAAWDGAAERLDIDMQKGLVSVTGPVTEGAVAVRAGQHLTVDVRSQEVVLHRVEDRRARAPDVPASGGDRGSEDDGVPSSSSPPDRAPAPTPPPTPSISSSSRSGTGGAAKSHPVARAAAGSHEGAGGPGPAAHGWAAALAAGDLDGVLADAERRGLKTTLAHAPAADLAALADAARYRRRTVIARRALLAERARFPDSGRARDAAFLIGRIEDDSPGGGARAIEWYDRYLEEAPAGAYASEALGRKMTATDRTRGIEAARAIARDYLGRFPGGTYAAAARAFLDRP